MKKAFDDIFQISGLLCIVLCLLLVVCLVVLAIKPLRDMALSTFFGSIYYKAGETVLTTEGIKTETLAIYKAKNKPFLIVGPCWFHENQNFWKDFFFVNPNRVIRTNVDQDGDIWVRLPWLLFIDDDLTSSDCVRTPYWDELERKGASVRYDEATSSYVYRFWINEPKQSVSFAIPKKLFPEDLLEAPRPAWN